MFRGDEDVVEDRDGRGSGGSLGRLGRQRIRNGNNLNLLYLLKNFWSTFLSKQTVHCLPKICAVDEAVTASDIDTFVLVFVGWFAFGGLVLAAIHFLLRREIRSPTSYILSNHLSN